MRILFLCQYFPPEPGAPAARTHEHAREWVAAGHEVTVVCGIPNHPDGVIPTKYQDKLIVVEDVDGIRVLRCWLFVTPNKGVIRRSISFLTFMISSVFFALVMGRKCDVVIATSPQLLCGLAGWVVSCFKRSPFVLEVRDLWPRQIVDLGVIENQVIIRQLYKLESFMYRHAAAIVTVADAAREYILDLGIPEERVQTITNAIDEQLFNSQDRMNRQRHGYGWENRTIVSYLGTHGVSQGLETVLEAAKLLQSREELYFPFVGAGACWEDLRTQAREMELNNVEFIPAQPKVDMPGLYAASDICLVPLKKRDIFLTNIPSKMFEIMACARPIVLGVEGQARTLLEEADAGIAVPPEDPQALANAIETLADDPELRARYGKNGVQHVKQYYCRSLKAKEYLEVLEQVLGKSEKTV